MQTPTSSSSSATTGGIIQFPTPSPLIFRPYETNAHIKFALRDPQVRLDSLTWKVEEPASSPNDDGLDHPLRDLASWDFGKNTGSGLFLNLPPSPSSSSSLDRIAQLNLGAFYDPYFHQFFDHVMIISLNWTLPPPNTAGHTTSPGFLVVRDDDTSDASLAHQKHILQNSPYAQARDYPDDSDSRDIGHGTTTSASALASSSADGYVMSVEDGAQSNELNDGGGLSRVTIAGIVVGALLAAFLAVGLGTFLFLRRRRRHRRCDHGGGAVDNDGGAAIEHKKLSSLVAVEENLHSNNGMSHHNLSDPAIALYHDESLQPHHHHYQQENTTDAAVSAAAATAPAYPETARAAAAATPTSNRTSQGVSRHLVEEGMTADEIRRLEEEEAQLDEEIWRAGRRR